MSRFIKSLVYIYLALSSICTRAWVVPPQSGITDATPGEEPNMVAVTYTSDWYEPVIPEQNDNRELTYKRLQSFHNGLMIRNDMVLVNKPPFDITKAKPEKYSVVSELFPSGTSLPVAKVHNSGNYNILELNCQIKGVDKPRMGFGEVTRNSISEGIAATIYFRNHEGVLKRSVQPLVKDDTYFCDERLNFCAAYRIDDWADQVRNNAPHGGPVFYNDANGVKKIIALLDNGGWEGFQGFYNGKPIVYYAHLKPIDSLEDFIVRTIGLDNHKRYEWTPASSDKIPKGAFVVGSEGYFDFKLCSATVDQGNYSGFIGQQFVGPIDDTNPIGCVVVNGDREVTVARTFSVLRGQPDYNWVKYKWDLAWSNDRLLQASDDGTTVCRSADENNQRIGWVSAYGDDEKCNLVGTDGTAVTTFNFEVLLSAPEKPACKSNINNTSSPTDNTGATSTEPTMAAPLDTPLAGPPAIPL